MKKIVTSLLLCMLSQTALQAESYFRQHHCDKGDISRYDNELSERDWEDLYDFLNTKRTINLQEKSCNLTIAGDVRVDWRYTDEKGLVNGEYRQLRGGDAYGIDGYRWTHNDFDVEFNLYFDYVCNRAWAVSHLQFDNSMGAEFNDQDSFANPQEEANCRDPHGFHGSGFGCDLYLRKAYIGYNICCCNDTRLDVELGRRHLYHVFDSEVQFLSRFDGLLLRWTSSECFFDYYVNLGGFVIDERSDHFGYVGEAGLLNICDYGVDVKYSLINWHKRGRNRCPPPNNTNSWGERFLNSQFTLAYHFDPEMINVPAKLYGAYLINHDASRNALAAVDDDDDDGRLANKAWYVGFRAGEVVECGDWAIDMQYQYVEAESIPDSDVSGIGRGNIRDETTTVNGRGNTNYKGWRVEALYALTSNITIDARFQTSQQIIKSIGGKHHYSQLRVETIYAF